MEEVVNYLNSVRRDYAGTELNKKSVKENPFDQLAIWMEDAVNAQVLDPAAMIVSTIGRDNRPSARTVLLRGVREDGIIFYTNYNSNKSDALSYNPYVAVTFLWNELNRQIRITGKAEKISREASVEYFLSRPRESQISAIVSPQSSIVESRAQLEDLVSKKRGELGDGEIKCPENWGGFMIKIDSFEFWQGRPNRLHDRIIYRKQDSETWEIDRLAP